ncbi:MAG: hypothetical protein E7H57_13180 [Pantoea sp.]|nr:hypothetical protein [Pantoea sp.]
MVGDSAQNIVIDSNPTGADFVIKDNTGQAIASGKTPQTVSLKKSDGSYFGGKDYSVTLTKDNYTATTLPIISHANGWYIGGNLVFGGLIGWLIVDPLNGGMWTLKPDEIHTQLAAQK